MQTRENIIIDIGSLQSRCRGQLRMQLQPVRVFSFALRACVYMHRHLWTKVPWIQLFGRLSKTGI